MEIIEPNEYFIQQLQERIAGLRKQYAEIFNIFSYTHKQELTCLNWLVSLLPECSQVIEIGSHLGASACFMAAAAKENNSFLTCVDTWDFRGLPEKDQKENPNSWENFKKFFENIKQFKEIITTLPFESSKLAKTWESWGKGKIYNLLFIDGDHSHEGVSADIESWIPLCAPGCIVVFHDYGGKYGRPAIQKAVEEKIWPIQKGPGNIFDSLYWCTI
jgi:predicted O-methyltransferase YrrM